MLAAASNFVQLQVLFFQALFENLIIFPEPWAELATAEVATIAELRKLSEVRPESLLTLDSLEFIWYIKGVDPIISTSHFYFWWNVNRRWRTLSVDRKLDWGCHSEQELFLFIFILDLHLNSCGLYPLLLFNILVVGGGRLLYSDPFALYLAHATGRLPFKLCVFILGH